ncbi:hypothetical protein CLM85_12400, partial [Streptomyces albidoflavus]|uniref:hypothetical protein n=1 Tax=Streptomyces albidoflavus TaxID=1886 RepID=UPI000BD008C1
MQAREADLGGLFGDAVAGGVAGQRRAGPELAGALAGPGTGTGGGVGEAERHFSEGLAGQP